MSKYYVKNRLVDKKYKVSQKAIPSYSASMHLGP